MFEFHELASFSFHLLIDEPDIHASQRYIYKDNAISLLFYEDIVKCLPKIYKFGSNTNSKRGFCFVVINISAQSSALLSNKVEKLLNGLYIRRSCWQELFLWSPDYNVPSCLFLSVKSRQHDLLYKNLYDDGNNRNSKILTRLERNCDCTGCLLTKS